MEKLLEYIFLRVTERLHTSMEMTLRVTKNRLSSFYRMMQREGIRVPDEYVRPARYRDADRSARQNQEL